MAPNSSKDYGDHHQNGERRPLLPSSSSASSEVSPEQEEQQEQRQKLMKRIRWIVLFVIIFITAFIITIVWLKNNNKIARSWPFHKRRHRHKKGYNGNSVPISGIVNNGDDYDSSYDPLILNEVKKHLNALNAIMDGTVWFRDITKEEVEDYNEYISSYKEASMVWRQDVTQPSGDIKSPFAVIEVYNEDDVQHVMPVVTMLSEIFFVPFRIRSGGHNKAGYSTTTTNNGIVVSLRHMNRVKLLTTEDEDDTTPLLDDSTVDDDYVIAKVEPGATVEHILDTILSKQGYSGSVGECGNVAEGGWVLGGGVGFMSRAMGLGIDNVLEYNVVLFNGTKIVANSKENDDLFWSLRGAGSGNYGIVTSFKYKMYSTPTKQRFMKWNISIYDTYDDIGVTDNDNEGVQNDDSVNATALASMATKLDDGNDSKKYNSVMARLLYNLGREKKNKIRREFNMVVGSVDAIYVSWFSRDQESIEECDGYFNKQIVPFTTTKAEKDVTPSMTPKKGHGNTKDNSAITSSSSNATTASTKNPLKFDIFEWPSMTHSYFDRGYGKYVYSAQVWQGFLFPVNNTLDIWNDIIRIMQDGFNKCPNLEPHIELWGGAISDVANNATSFPYREAVYNVGLQLYILQENDYKSFLQQVEYVTTTMWPRISQYLTGAYLNYPMNSLSKEEYPTLYFGQHLQRLIQIKQKYDPYNIFNYEQSIPIQ